MESSVWFQQLQVITSVFVLCLEPPGHLCAFAMFEGKIFSVSQGATPTRSGLGTSGEGPTCPLALVYFSLLLFLISSPFLYLSFLPIPLPFSPFLSPFPSLFATHLKRPGLGLLWR